MSNYPTGLVAGNPSCVTRGGRMAVGDGVWVMVGVNVSVGVVLGVKVSDGVNVMVGDGKGVGDGVSLGVMVGVRVGVGLGPGVTVGVRAAMVAPTSMADVGGAVAVNSEVGSKPGPELTCTLVRLKVISTCWPRPPKMGCCLPL